MVIGQHQYVRGEPNLAGARREVAEGSQGSPIARPMATEFGCGQADVLTTGQMVVAEAISGLGDPGDVLDGGGGFPGP